MMDSPQFRAVWISDTHLGTRACRVEALREFLSAVECEWLYLVGDIIDLESMRRRWYWPASHEAVVRKLFALARRGVKVVYIPGNHDEMFRAYAGLRFGRIDIRRNAVHYTADARKVLILHGDEFDRVVRDHPVITAVGDWFYDRLLALGRLYDRARLRFGWPYWSPAAWVKDRVKSILTLVTNFHADLAAHARDRKADVVVTGHIHRPEIKPMDGLTYTNCGDWVENCTALVEHADGRLEVLHVGRDGMTLRPAADPVPVHA
jgi:UDP-2,3-diacylglucosamine pyrophosphatase LpxH